MKLSFGRVEGLLATEAEVDETLKRLVPFLMKLKSAKISPMVSVVMGFDELNKRGHEVRIDYGTASEIATLFLARQNALSKEEREQMQLDYDISVEGEDTLLIALSCAYITGVMYQKACDAGSVLGLMQAGEKNE